MLILVRSLLLSSFLFSGVVAMSSEPPIYGPAIGSDELVKTGVAPAELDLPYCRSGCNVAIRSPYKIKPSSQINIFSLNESAIERYFLEPLDKHEGSACLKFNLWGEHKIVRGYEDWPSPGQDPLPVNPGLSWRVGLREAYDIAANDVIVIYQDAYLIVGMTERGVQLKRVTEKSPTLFKGLSDCRALPFSPRHYSPLFHTREKNGDKYGFVSIRSIQATDGTDSAEAEVALFSPDVDHSQRPSPLMIKLKVGDSLSAKSFQSYQVRRIVPPQQVRLGNSDIGRIQGWIEIDVVPSSGKSGT